jgi:shikimate kinase
LGSSTTSSPLGRRALLNAEGLIVHIYAPQLRTISRLKENPSHPIGEFALDECDASQLSRIQRIRADNYYSADLRLNTAHLSISETARTLARLSGL